MHASAADVDLVHISPGNSSWMTVNEKRLFLQEYENTPTVYQNQSRA